MQPDDAMDGTDDAVEASGTSSFLQQPQVSKLGSTPAGEATGCSSEVHLPQRNALSDITISAQ